MAEINIAEIAPLDKKSKNYSKLIYKKKEFRIILLYEKFYQLNKY